MYPFIHITQSIQIPTYLVLISLIFCLGLVALKWRARQYHAPLNHGLNIAMAIMIGGFLGARAVHILYEHPQLYWQHSMQVFRFWEGGFVFYGGALGALAGSLVVIRLKNYSFTLWAQIFTPLFSLGYALGRVSCFLNGCCYGKFCELPWAIQFAGHSGKRHPTQLYSVALEILVFIFLLWVDSKYKTYLKARKPAPWYFSMGIIFPYWVILHSLFRIVVEHFRDDDRGPLVLGILSLSSALSIVFIVCSLISLSLNFRPRAHTASQ